MKKKGIALTIVLCAVVALVGTIVIVNRKSAASGNENVIASLAQSEEGSAIVSANETEVAESETGAVKSDVQLGSSEKQAGDQTDGKVAAEPNNGQIESITSEAQQVIPKTAANEPIAVDDTPAGEVSSTDDEIEEIELPEETDIPKDWDWEKLPESQTKDPTSTTAATSEKSSSDESGEEESQTESATEKSGEESGTEGANPEKENQGEKSSEDVSSEEKSSEEESCSQEGESDSEPETTTLSPEVQASLVESATAPIELPKIPLE